jgi:hypothetical protein
MTVLDRTVLRGQLRGLITTVTSHRWETTSKTFPGPMGVGATARLVQTWTDL